MQRKQLRLMKTCFMKLCDILTHLFNLKLSRLWKMPCLVPVPKSHLTNHNDYRPVMVPSHVIKGVFTPIACLLWSQTVDELVNCSFSLWFGFTQKKFCMNQTA